MVDNVQNRSSRRSKIIAGQIKGLQKMIDTDAYCMDILTQSLAVQKSLASLSKLVLENHLRTHITQMLSSGSQSEQTQAVGELLDLYEIHNIRGK